MSVIIRLQNLPWNANALDIRQFFYGLSIPDGGVHIIGGEKGDAFIAFSTDEDARRAMLTDGGKINDLSIRLFLSSKTEMQNVIIAARDASNPPAGPVQHEPFGHPLGHEVPRDSRGFDGYEFGGQTNRAVPPQRNVLQSSVAMGGDNREDWLPGLGPNASGLQFPPARQEFRPMGGGPVARMNPIPDVGQRPPVDKPSFGMPPPFDAPAPIGSFGGAAQGLNFGGGRNQLGGELKQSSFGDSRVQSSFGSEWGQPSSSRDPGAHLRDGRGSDFDNFGNLEQSRLMDKNFARGNIDNRMHEELMDKGRWLGNPEVRTGFGKNDGGGDFSRVDEGFGRGLRKLPDQPSIGRPNPGQDFMLRDPGSDFRSRDNRQEFGRPDFDRESLGRNVSGISREEHLRRLIDERTFGQNKNEGADFGRSFPADVSRIPPVGARELGMSRSEFGDRGSESLRADAFSRSDLGFGFPRSEVPQSQPAFGREFERGGLDGARLGVQDGSLGRGLRDDVRGFGLDPTGAFPPRPGFGRGEPKVEPPTFGPDSRLSSFVGNFGDDKPGSRLLGPPGTFLNPPREFLNRGPEAGQGLRTRMDERGFDDAFGRERFSSRSGGGLWVRVSNLPVSYNYREVCRFFTGCEIPTNGLKLVNDKFGNRMGLAYIKFGNVQTAIESLKLSGRMVDGCRVVVESCGEVEYEDTVDNYKPASLRDHRGGRSRSRSPVRRHSPMRGEKVCAVVKNLSSGTTEADIKGYFSKSIVAKNGGPFLEINADGRPTGCALVQFDSVRDLNEAVIANRRRRSLNGVDIKVITIRKVEFEDRSRKARLVQSETNGSPGKPISKPVADKKEEIKTKSKEVEVVTAAKIPPAAASEGEKSVKPESAGSTDAKPCCVEIRGVPWTTNITVIRDFFKGLNIAANGIHILLDNEGRAAGSVYVEFATAADCMKGLQRNRQYIGKRYVNIVLIGRKQMQAEIANKRTMPDPGAKPDGPSPLRPAGNPSAPGKSDGEATVGLKNLNFQTQLEDILEFFQGYHPIVDSIKLQYKDGKPTGDGLTTFPNMEEAQSVIQHLNRKVLLGRPILLSLWTRDVA